MSIVRLGALLLRWCHNCNLPVLKQKRCGKCNSETKSVSVTPPGDIRPAFEYDKKLIRDIINQQFGDKTGSILIPENTLVLLNRAPGLDTIDEIIIDGMVVGSLYFNITGLNFKIIMRLEGADLIKDSVEHGFVTIDEGAEKPISKGASVLIPGIIDISSGIKKGDEVIIFNKSKNVIATGTAKLSSEEISTRDRGSAVKTRWYGGFEPITRLSSMHNWEDAIEANRIELNNRVENSIRFIKKADVDYDLPIIVSFSGGKDSLATLLLVLEAGIKPDILFINTGLELPETIEFTSEVADKYNLNLIIEDAGDSFWTHIDFFGPPGKDFRWCCKTCKLGPAASAIKSKFPDGVLSFIGQRSYESEPRSKKGPIWRNPWVPGQLAASPIQKWTSLHVWLYLFSKKAPVNPWYERGLDRIGCWLCPASNLSELQVIKEHFDGYKIWEQKLREFSEGNDIKPAWINLGLWRWKKPPRELLNLLTNSEDLEDLNKTISGKIPMKNNKSQLLKQAVESNAEIYQIGNYNLISLGGFEDCKGSISLEAIFDFQFDINHISKLLNILGPTEITDNADSINVGKSATLFKNGTLSIQGKDKKVLERNLYDIFSIIIKSKDCVNCNICFARCPNDALYFDDSLQIDLEKCNHCKKCLRPCTVVDFEKDKISEF